MHACCSQAFSLRRFTFVCRLHSGPSPASYSPYLPLDFCATRLSPFAPPEFDVVSEVRQASILTSACQSMCGHESAGKCKLNTFSLDKNRHIVAFRVDDGVSWTGRAKSVRQQSTEQTRTRCRLSLIPEPYPTGFHRPEAHNSPLMTKRKHRGSAPLCPILVNHLPRKPAQVRCQSPRHSTVFRHHSPHERGHQALSNAPAWAWPHNPRHPTTRNTERGGTFALLVPLIKLTVVRGGSSQSTTRLAYARGLCHPPAKERRPRYVVAWRPAVDRIDDGRASTFAAAHAPGVLVRFLAPNLV